jgi:hypothetical protein
MPVIAVEHGFAYELYEFIKQTDFKNYSASYSPQSVLYDIIFNNASQYSLDILADHLHVSKDWLNILLLKRICEIGGYDSRIIESALLDALNNIPMLDEGLVQTIIREKIVRHDHYLERIYVEGFHLNNAFALYGYKWAAHRNITRWNVTRAYHQLRFDYELHPVEGLLIAEDQNGFSDDSRYYDEQAQVIRCLDILAECGAPEASNYASSIWNRLLTYHNNSDYWYSDNGYFFYRPYWKVWEAEMGGFALIVSNHFGGPPSQILNDINMKLLNLHWSSGGWSNHLIRHAYVGAQCPDGSGKDSSEGRIAENVGVWRVLHSLYPHMTPAMQTHMISMQDGSADGTSAAEWYIHEPAFMVDSLSRLNGLMTAFLSAIIPASGSLDLGFLEEGCTSNHEYNLSQLKFDYCKRQIRIRVKAGMLLFNFGSRIASYTFPVSGTFDIQFSCDWNTILKAVKIGESDFNETVSEVMIHPIQFFFVSLASTISMLIAAYKRRHGKKPSHSEYRGMSA